MSWLSNFSAAWYKVYHRCHDLPGWIHHRCELDPCPKNLLPIAASGPPWSFRWSMRLRWSSCARLADTHCYTIFRQSDSYRLRDRRNGCCVTQDELLPLTTERPSFETMRSRKPGMKEAVNYQFPRLASIWPCNSVVEQRWPLPEVVGSNPTGVRVFSFLFLRVGPFPF